MKNKKPLMLIIDGNFFAFRAYATRKLQTSAGVPTSVISGIIQMVKNLHNSYGHENLIICWDAKGGSQLRKKIFKDYKGTRGEKPEDLKVQLKMAYRFFKAMNVRQARIKGIEGDDLMGMFSHYFSENGYKVIIVSGDKDLWQLVKKRVAIWRPIRKELISLKVFKKMFDGLTPQDFLKMKSLIGDKGDNIPGIQGIGPKTADKIVRRYGTLKNILKHSEEDKNAAIVKKNIKIVRLAYDLSRIRTDHKELGIINKKFNKMTDSFLRKRKVGEEKIHRLVRSLEMKHRNFEALAKAFSVIAV